MHHLPELLGFKNCKTPLFEVFLCAVSASHGLNACTALSFFCLFALHALLSAASLACVFHSNKERVCLVLLVQPQLGSSVCVCSLCFKESVFH
jgi:hypothetical protein